MAEKIVKTGNQKNMIKRKHDVNIKRPTQNKQRISGGSKGGRAGGILKLFRGSSLTMRGLEIWRVKSRWPPVLLDSRDRSFFGLLHFGNAEFYNSFHFIDLR